MNTMCDSLSICRKATEEYLYALLPATSAMAPQRAINVNGNIPSSISRSLLLLFLLPTMRWMVGKRLGQSQSMHVDINTEFDMCNVVRMVA
mmetsp:Transcript_22150/g.40742  ORF Transcript_22150/g.40742 Transcript_22150/m.40742 type:complete len:91 (+) Transcript_22150:739-1011(+)